MASAGLGGLDLCWGRGLGYQRIINEGELLLHIRCKHQGGRHHATITRGLLRARLPRPPISALIQALIQASNPQLRRQSWRECLPGLLFDIRRA